MRVAIACPYAWDARAASRSTCASSRSTCSAAATRSSSWPRSHAATPAVGACRSGRPIDDPVQRLERADRSPPVVPAHRPPAALARVRARRGPRPRAVRAGSSGLSATLASRVAGRGHVPFVADARAALRPVGAAAPSARRAAGGPRRRVGTAPPRSTRPGSAARSVWSPTASTSHGSRRRHRPTSATGRKLLFVGRLDERKGFPVAVRAFAELAPGPARPVARGGRRRTRAGGGGQPPAGGARPRHDARRRAERGAPADHAACDLYLSRRPAGELRARAGRGDGGGVAGGGLRHRRVRRGRDRRGRRPAGPAGGRRRRWRARPAASWTTRTWRRGCARRAGRAPRLRLDRRGRADRGLLPRGAGHRRRRRYDRAMLPPCGSSSASSSSSCWLGDLTYNRLVRPRTGWTTAGRRSTCS